ncbi:hypothetical protein [Actinomycetospora chiangmaiensis]|nr:hypothetical protein [Actinomycetospora chiangmaiensis]
MLDDLIDRAGVARTSAGRLVERAARALQCSATLEVSLPKTP